MNRFNKILMILSSLALLMFACQDNTNVEPDKEKEKPYLNYESETDFWFSKEKGDTVIVVADVNGAYSATVAEGGEWCTVSDISVNYFIINYEENKRAENRTTKITLSMEGVDDIELVVSQRGSMPVLIIDSVFAEVSAPYMGADTVVIIDKTNGDYKVDIEAGNEWCSVANRAETGLQLNIAPNNGLTGRSATVSVSLSYADSTVSFEFVVRQLSTPLLLNAPQDETVINKSSDFPYTFSWNQTGEGAITGYTIAVSASSDFPEDATITINAGDVGEYTLTSNDLARFIGEPYKARTLLYWKVMPTNDIDIATETKRFYILRQLTATYPLTLNPNETSWATILYDEEDGHLIMQLNAGQSSRRVFIATDTLTEIPPRKILAIVYDYKITNRPVDPPYEYDVVDVYHAAFAWNKNAITLPCPFTDEWRTNVVTIPEEEELIVAGKYAKFYITTRPPVITSNNNTIAGTRFHIRNLRLEVYSD
jgi:hypothetical protein